MKCGRVACLRLRARFACVSLALGTVHWSFPRASSTDFTLALSWPQTAERLGEAADQGLKRRISTATCCQDAPFLQFLLEHGIVQGLHEDLEFGGSDPSKAMPTETSANDASAFCLVVHDGETRL